MFAQRRLIEAQKEEIEHERARSDRLLLEMLPAPIAERLRMDPGVIADRVEDVTILFADLVGFTPLAEHMRPEDVVELLNMLFSRFDDLTYGFGLEKIKTSGDGYMAAGGLDGRGSSHARDVVRLGLAMIGEVEATAAARALDIALRVGIHTGPVVAGVIGKHRYSYDIWGDTVNVASRMESHGIPGAVQLSEATKLLVEAEYPCIPGKDIEVKGHGRMRVYLVEREEGRGPLSHPPGLSGIRNTRWSPSTSQVALPTKAKSVKSISACSMNRRRSSPATGGIVRSFTAPARSRNRPIMASTSKVLMRGVPPAICLRGDSPLHPPSVFPISPGREGVRADATAHRLLSTG